MSRHNSLNPLLLETSPCLTRHPHPLHPQLRMVAEAITKAATLLLLYCLNMLSSTHTIGKTAVSSGVLWQTHTQDTTLKPSIKIEQIPLQETPAPKTQPGQHRLQRTPACRGALHHRSAPALPSLVAVLVLTASLYIVERLCIISSSSAASRLPAPSSRKASRATGSDRMGPQQSANTGSLRCRPSLDGKTRPRSCTACLRSCINKVTSSSTDGRRAGSWDQHLKQTGGTLYVWHTGASFACTE